MHLPPRRLGWILPQVPFLVLVLLGLHATVDARGEHVLDVKGDPIVYGSSYFVHSLDEGATGNGGLLYADYDTSNSTYYVRVASPTERLVSEVQLQTPSALEGSHANYAEDFFVQMGSLYWGFQQEGADYFIVLTSSRYKAKFKFNKTYVGRATPFTTIRGCPTEKLCRNLEFYLDKDGFNYLRIYKYIPTPIRPGGVRIDFQPVEPNNVLNIKTGDLAE